MARAKPKTKKAAPKKAAPKKAARKAVKKPPAKRTKKAAAKPPAPPAGEQGALFAPDPELTNVLDERLLVPQRVAAIAFGITVEALKKWKIKAHSKRGRETLYYLPDLIRYRVARADQFENKYMEDKARLARAQAEKVELEIAALRGELVPPGLVLEHLEPMVMAARQKMLALHVKCKTQIPGLSADQVGIIQKLARQCLDDISNAGLPTPSKRAIREALR